MANEPKNVCDTCHEQSAPHHIRERLTWNAFLLLQPVFLFYAYLVGCFSTAVMWKPRNEFPLDHVSLYYVLPSALAVSLVTYVIIRKCTTTASATIILFVAAPLGGAALGHLIMLVVLLPLQLHP